MFRVYHQLVDLKNLCAQIAKSSTWKNAKTSKITARDKLETVGYELCVRMHNSNCFDCFFGANELKGGDENRSQDHLEPGWNL